MAQKFLLAFGRKGLETLYREFVVCFFFYFVLFFLILRKDASRVLKVMGQRSEPDYKL